MNIDKARNAATADEAMRCAIEWQQWSSGQTLSYAEIAAWGEVFRTLAEMFALTEEFDENGII